MASRAASYLRISVFHRGFASVDGNSANVGDVVYVELPEEGAPVLQGSFGAVEIVKATSDFISPISGKVVEVNEELKCSMTLLVCPYDKGWIIKVKVSDSGELNNLMDADKYTKFCEEEDASKSHLVRGAYAQV
ncbi:hypothetical protein RGQ29_006398 [Quercus rubra]|uniref:Glycine cleavage system H protein n=1 Tax=Quercus rubra TaxID=3512 RepID=A0AAN7E814_QUERU|nr:hypothetical protein RGQ29_006398 [Quercus rubra]